jgi:competence protein ComEA
MFHTLLAVITVAGLVAAPHPLDAAQSNGAAGSAAKPAVTGPININTASATDLQTLPGIGAKTAGRIIEYRQKNGPFKKIEELMNVRGVGEKNFLKLKNQISVGAPRSDRASSQP